MMRSLRARLVSLLTFAIALAGCIQFLASFATARTEANKVFDLHMQQLAESIAESRKEEIERYPFFGKGSYDFVIQLWQGESNRVYQSRVHRFLPEKAPRGFSTVTLSNGEWRIYSVQAEHQVIQVAQKIKERERRAISLALHALWPIVPISILLIISSWWVVTVTLSPMNKIGRELAQRNANALDPLTETGVPTEALNLVLELNKLLKRLGVALAIKQRFVADAAHELRSPLTALKLQVQNLIRAKDRHEQELATKRLLGGVDRATRTLEQLLTLARQGAEPSIATAEPVNLNSCIDEVVKDLIPLAEPRKIKIDMVFDAPLVVRGDAEALKIMIRNLVDNAIRYGPGDSTVVIATYMSEGKGALAVTDHGQGIPYAYRARVFDRFYRVPGTAASGSGLGLSIVQAILERHRSSVDFFDLEHGGFQVRVTFPLAS